MSLSSQRIASLRVFLPALVALLALSGCAAKDVVSTDNAGYISDTDQRVAAVDWNRATTIDVALSEYNFLPESLHFQQGQPYHLHFTNQGAEVHDFASKPFFQAIAVAKLVDSQRTIPLPHLISIGVEPGKSKDLYFVPVRPGSYRFECNEPLHATFGMTGVAQIE
jgi:uncharacterized cupredoxin-like copper-binding protein